MRGVCIDVDVPRIVATRVLGLAWKGAFFGPWAPLRFVCQPSGELPSPRAVRVRNRLAGICGSDLSLAFLKADLDVMPALLNGPRRLWLGHEVVGEVTEPGTGVKGLFPGERVVLRQDPGMCAPAGRDPCPACRNGNYNRCDGIGGEDAFPVLGGGWADEMVVSAGQLYRVPPEVTDEEAVMLEPAACALRGVLRAELPLKGTALVIGAGTIGLLALRLARTLSPGCRVIVSARHPFQAEKARTSGAARVVDGGTDLFAAVAEETGARVVHGNGGHALLGGVDRVIDCVGTARTIGEALRLTRAGGRVVVVGVDLRPGRFDYTPVWFREVDLVGTYLHGREAVRNERPSTFDLVVRLLREKRLAVGDLLTHRYRLADWKKALAEASDKRGMPLLKAIFDHAA